MWGSIEPNDPNSAVGFYQFTLPAGQVWQVGLAISAQSIDSPFLADLALFNSSGTLLADSRSGQGLPGDQNDPYLFAGLPGGTYYVGVSGTGNLPYGTGGYNPVLGLAGLNAIPQPGGAYALSLIATPHTQATRVVSYSLDTVSSDDTSPIGITVTFSGSINLNNLFVPDVQETALAVVNSQGQYWPLTSDTYNVADSSLEMIFDRPLPPGEYTLLSSPTGGLVDLAGQPVLGAHGSSTVLATWTVAPPAQPLAAGNLGVWWPMSANDLSSLTSGSFEESEELAPGQSAEYHFTVIVPGYYKLITEIPQGSVAVSVSGNGKLVVLDPGSTNALNSYPMLLNSGVYTMRLANVSPESIAFNWKLVIESLDFEKLQNNGVGQSFALALSLFSPDPEGSSGASGASSSSDASSGSDTSSDSGASVSGASAWGGICVCGDLRLWQ